MNHDRPACRRSQAVLLCTTLLALHKVYRLTSLGADSVTKCHILRLKAGMMSRSGALLRELVDFGLQVELLQGTATARTCSLFRRDRAYANQQRSKTGNPSGGSRLAHIVEVSMSPCTGSDPLCTSRSPTLMTTCIIFLNSA